MFFLINFFKCYPVCIEENRFQVVIPKMLKIETEGPSVNKDRGEPVSSWDLKNAQIGDIGSTCVFFEHFWNSILKPVLLCVYFTFL
jgi:hypothetical protein